MELAGILIGQGLLVWLAYRGWTVLLPRPRRAISQWGWAVRSSLTAA